MVTAEADGNGIVADILTRSKQSSAANSLAWARARLISKYSGCEINEARRIYARITLQDKNLINWEDKRSLRAAINKTQKHNQPQNAGSNPSPKSAGHTLQSKLRAIADYIDTCGSTTTAIAHIDALAALTV